MGAMPIECAHCRPRCRSACKVDSATCNRRKLLSGVLAEFSLRTCQNAAACCRTEHTRERNKAHCPCSAKYWTAWNGVTRDDLPCKRARHRRAAQDRSRVARPAKTASRPTLQIDGRKKLLASFRLCPECSQQAACHHRHVRLVYAPRRHAFVPSFDHHADSMRF